MSETYYNAPYLRDGRYARRISKDATDQINAFNKNYREAQGTNDGEIFQKMNAQRDGLILLQRNLEMEMNAIPQDDRGTVASVLTKLLDTLESCQALRPVILRQPAEDANSDLTDGQNSDPNDGQNSELTDRQFSPRPNERENRDNDESRQQDLNQSRSSDGDSLYYDGSGSGRGDDRSESESSNNENEIIENDRTLSATARNFSTKNLENDVRRGGVCIATSPTAAAATAAASNNRSTSAKRKKKTASPSSSVEELTRTHRSASQQDANEGQMQKSRQKTKWRQNNELLR